MTTRAQAYVPAELIDAERKCQRCRQKLDKAVNAAKAARKEYDETCNDLHLLIRDLAEPGLFDNGS